MKLSFLVFLTFLCGCVSAQKKDDAMTEAYARGVVAGKAQSDSAYRDIHGQCVEQLKDSQDRYYKIYGRFIKEQNNARTDK